MLTAIRLLPTLCASLFLAGTAGAFPGDPVVGTGDDSGALPPKLVLPGTGVLQDEAAAEQEPTLAQALGSGRSWVSLRYRFENVDQGGFSKDANASTLRTTLGYETGTWNGLSVLLEAEDVSPIGDDNYNSGINGVTDRPKVIDPNGTEVNQSYLRYTGWKDGDARIGRQEISIDNHRFVGNVGWRQNHQSFDAWSLLAHAPAAVDIFAAYVTNVNTVLGESNPGGDQHMGSFLFNAMKDFEGVGELNVFLYNLDYDTTTVLSTETYGASLAGDVDAGSVGILYRAAYANQTDTGDNPNDVSASYTNLELGVDLDAVVLKVGSEVLEGSGATGDRFTTPLATLHKFNGWADIFLNTPDTGLEDLYFSVGGTWRGTKLLAVYHDFQSDTGSIDYGTEIDLQAVRTFENGITGGLKYASYSADDFATDKDVFWFWVAYSF